MAEFRTAISGRPLISVIIPSLNQGEFIETTVRSALNQEYGHVEVWVIDGGSRDQTVDVLTSIGDDRLRWISEPDRGFADAVNKGFGRARGELIGIQSADDFYEPGALSGAAEIFADTSDLVFISGTVRIVDRQGRETGTVSLPFDRRRYSLEDCVGFRWFPSQGATFVRRDAVLEVGGCDVAHDWVADTDLWFRLLAEYLPRGYGAEKLSRTWANVREHDARRARYPVRFATGRRRAAQAYAKRYAGTFSRAQSRALVRAAWKDEFQTRVTSGDRGLALWWALASLVRSSRSPAEWLDLAALVRDSLVGQRSGAVTQDRVAHDP